MSQRTISIIVLIFSIVSFAMQAQEISFTTEDYEIEMGDWTSSAKLTLPADAESAVPLLILFHGSGPYDMDSTFSLDPFSDEEPISHNFLTIAETLSDEGLAVLRFNKRGVNAYGDYDFAQVQASTLDILISDANAVIDFAKELSSINPEQIYLYGWSEGAWVIANVATMRDDIAGLVMQGAPQGSLADILPYQYQDLALTYFRDEIDSDGDGLLSLDDVANVPLGPVQYMIPFFFYQPGSDANNPTANTFVDANGDSIIDIDGELAPAIEMYLGNLSYYLPEVEASYDASALLSESNIPTLLLHGENDGWTVVSGAEAVFEANPETVTLNIYPDLGHALSLTDSPAEDGFYPMEAEPLQDLLDWLQSQ